MQQFSGIIRSPFLVLALLMVTGLNGKLSAVEFEFKGLVELNLGVVENNKNSTTDNDSFLTGNYGKFSADDGSTFSITQSALSLDIQWQSNFSAKIIGNAYLNGPKDGIGITEAYVKYKGIPNSQGIRLESKAGFIYPKVSMENIATAWSTPYSLSPSTLNSWLGEEVKHLGLELSIAKIGKITNSDFDFQLKASMFKNNDSSGALLAWHGWTQSSRQTLWHEEISLPNQQLREPGALLAAQANQSDPFIEIDNRFGHHFVASMKWKKNLDINFGSYDNRTRPYLIKLGNYGWHTKFDHIGFKGIIKPGWTVIGQYLSGSTLMQSPARMNVVYNDFTNAFILLSHNRRQHRFTVRYEAFDVDDMDYTLLDDNNETGNAATLAYIYRINRNYFFHSEFSLIDSERPSRVYNNQAVNLTEKQLSIAIRYYF